MVWTSDYPEGRPGNGSKPGAGSSPGSKGMSGSRSGKSAESGSKSGTAVAQNSLQSTSGSGSSAWGFSSSTGSAASGNGSDSRQSSTKGSSPVSKPNVNPISGGTSKQKPKGKPPAKPGIFLLLAGVILPCAAIVFELTTHMCARNFFDPLPTPAHVLLFALIPTSNLLVWVASRRNMTDLLGMLTLGTGMSMGVAILYSLMFLPIVPLSVVAILWCGFGLLALSPLLAIPAVWKAGKYAVHLSESQKTYFDGHQLEHIGHMIILCTVVAVELPSTMTRMHIGEAAHSAKPAAAIDWLRNWGNQEVMLRACYERSGRATDILGSLYEVKNPTSVDEARAIFYRVTGKPFNSVPLPAALRATRQNQGLLSDGENEEPNVEDEFDRDPDIAGEAVSGVARGLSMNESKLSGHIDGNSCIANLMWNVTFGNTSKYDREVRSKILLPPGAVVTNAFLIVNGTEREATVMGRSLARRKYRAAVADKKDPLLVSTCGADQVLLQLYPVAPESNIGVRLHIIAPLAVTQMSKAELALPTFEERNFQVDIPTKISLKSQENLVSSADEIRVETNGTTRIAQGSITTPELARFGAVVVADRNPSVTRIEGAHDGYLLSEEIKKINYPRPKAVHVVLDGSNGMSHHFETILKELRHIPSEIPLRISYVRDNLLPPISVNAGDVKAREDSLTQVAKIPCAGGQDNMKELKTELSDAINNDGAAVLWIHSAQPLPGKLDRHSELSIRKSSKPLLYDFAVAAGPNEILSGLYSCPGLVRVNRGSFVEKDLHGLFDTWQKATPVTELGGIVYSRKQLTDVEPGSIKPAETALAKLVAFDEISKIQTVHGNHRCKFARQAVALSNTYHLVTSFSSAIITDPVPQRRVQDQKIAPPAFQLHDPSILGSLPGMRQSGVMGGRFAPMKMQQRADGELERAKEPQSLQGKNLALGSAKDNFASSGNEGQFAQSVQGNTGTQSIASLQGATNGTIILSTGEKFSSAAAGGDAISPTSSMPAAAPAAPRLEAKRFSQSEMFGNSAEEMSSARASLAKARRDVAEAVDYPQSSRKSAHIDDFGSAKKELSDKKQVVSKSDVSDAEFNDDEGGNDSPVDELSSIATADNSAPETSPVVPESDTYILFGVGMLALGYALKTRKNVRFKKA